MNRKKILGLALSAVIAVGVLSGCGSSAASKTQATTTAAKTAAATTAAATTAAATTAAAKTAATTTAAATTAATSTAAKTPADAVTTASIVDKQDALLKALSKDGTWIVAILKDMTVDKEIVVEGEFHDKADKTKPVYRKFAPYTQDDKHNILQRFTLTAPKMTVKSENFRIQGGTFKGDVYVEAKGFNLSDAKVDGNVYFASEDVKSTFKMDKGTVTGKQEVKK